VISRPQINVLHVAGNKTVVARYVVILYRLIYVYNYMVVINQPDYIYLMQEQ